MPGRGFISCWSLPYLASDSNLVSEEVRKRACYSHHSKVCEFYVLVHHNTCVSHVSGYSHIWPRFRLSPYWRRHCELWRRLQQKSLQHCLSRCILANLEPIVQTSKAVESLGFMTLLEDLVSGFILPSLTTAFSADGQLYTREQESLCLFICCHAG